MNRIVIMHHISSRPRTYDFYGKVSAETYNALLSTGIYSIEDFKQRDSKQLWEFLYAHGADLSGLAQFLEKSGIVLTEGHSLYNAYLTGKMSGELYAWLSEYDTIEDMIEEGSYIRVQKLPYTEQEELERFISANGYPKAQLGYKRGVGAVLFISEK